MCDSYVIIEQPDRKAIYVAVLTKEGTGAFWNELSKEIARLHRPKFKSLFRLSFP